MLQNDREMLAYVNAKMNPFAPKVGGFLEAFLNACQRADYDNYSILRPALLAISQKYPADPTRLAVELEDIPTREEVV